MDDISINCLAISENIWIEKPYTPMPRSNLKLPSPIVHIINQHKKIGPSSNYRLRAFIESLELP